LFLPIGDTPNPRNFKPWVNWTLIGLNIAVFIFISVPLSQKRVSPLDPLLPEYLNAISHGLNQHLSLRRILATISAYDLFSFAHGYKPGAPEISDLFTSMFLHGGIFHLAGNMLFLWIYGDNVEHHLGRLGYLLAYLSTGAVATLTFSLFAGSSQMPLIGASGAISGVLGLYYLMFPRNKVKVFIVFFPFFMNVVLLPARLVLGVFVLIDNLLPFVFGASTNVAHGAHLGGFIAGLAMAAAGERLLWQKPWKKEVWGFGPPSTSSSQNGWDGAGASLELLRTAVAAGNSELSINILSKMEKSQISQLNVEECLRLAVMLDENGRSVAASKLLKICLANNPRSTNFAEIFLMLGLIRLKQNQPTAAYQYLLSVFDHQPSPSVEERARQALRRIDVFRRAG